MPSGTEVRDIQRRVRAKNCACIAVVVAARQSIVRPGRSQGSTAGQSMAGRCLSVAVGAKRVRRRLLAWRAAPGTTLETALHPLFHHRVFVHCKRSLVRLNRIVEGYKMLERLVY